MSDKKTPDVKKKVGRPRLGDEKRPTISVSLDCDVIEALEAQSGSVSMLIETACKAYYLIG